MDLEIVLHFTGKYSTVYDQKNILNLQAIWWYTFDVLCTT